MATPKHEQMAGGGTHKAAETFTVYTLPSKLS